MRTSLPVLEPAAAHAAYKAAWEALMVRLRMAPAGASLELGLKVGWGIMYFSVVVFCILSLFQTSVPSEGYDGCRCGIAIQHL